MTDHINCTSRGNNIISDIIDVAFQGKYKSWKTKNQE